MEEKNELLYKSATRRYVYKNLVQNWTPCWFASVMSTFRAGMKAAISANPGPETMPV